MYQLVFGSAFLRSSKRIDRQLKPKLKRSLDLLSENPFHPLLRSKPLTGAFSDYYSFRFGKDYRVIFKFTSQREIYLFDVGHRREIYR